ncbi:MAG TPA: putative transporter [Bacteroidales bacterium]|nr:putative transporter [Bacteroidales bacterium]
MNWLTDLIINDSVAHAILVYCVIIAAGVALGKVKIFNVSLGITFVLFAGIAAGHFGFVTKHEVIEFVRDFGLILFVFSIGLQVGPAFFSSLRKSGLKMNILAMLIVFTGALITIIIHFLANVPMPLMTGIMSGAVTNTPGLGAAQQTLSEITAGMDPEKFPDPSIGYAVAYPFGVVGVILSMIFIRKMFRINLDKELKVISEKLHHPDEIPEKVSIQVKSKKIAGKSVNEIVKNSPGKMVISRLLHKGELLLPGPDTVIEENDIILVVAEKKSISAIIDYIGNESDLDLSTRMGKMVSRRIVVTNPAVAGKSLGSLKLRSRYNINITRIERSGIEFVASSGLILQMGDRMTVVGDEGSIENVAREVGNSLRRLYEPNLIPIFVGIILGILLGSIPLNIPGVSNPIKLGLAGGSLIVAMFLSKFGHRFSLIPYTTTSANLMLRETGIVLFLASVGLRAGEKFIPSLTSGDGFIWMGYGAIITVLPVIFTGILAIRWMKYNYFEVCGLLAGSMTDPPALAYANNMAQSEIPAVAYATVYPLVMFLRILVAQLLILLFV